METPEWLTSRNKHATIPETEHIVSANETEIDMIEVRASSVPQEIQPDCCCGKGETAEGAAAGPNAAVSGTTQNMRRTVT